MEWSKLKNIIIIMLAAVNLFLLVLVVHRQWESRSSYESAREDALAVLWETSRIRLEREILPEELDLTPMSVTRDPELEETQAAALLGELTASPPEALRYGGAKGAAQFYVDGEFSAEFRTGAYPLAGAEPEEFAVDLLATIGFEAQVMSTEESGGETVVTLRQCWEGTPVFDRTAVLVFRRGASGQRIGERVCKAAEQPLHALLIVLNAGAPVRTGDHSADRTHRRPFAPDRHGLGGLRLLPARQDGEDRREPALADGGAVHVKLRAPHQVKGRNGQQDDEQTFPPLCQTALSFLRHGRAPPQAAPCGR